MADLQNLQISDTYDGLIKTNDEQPINGTLKTLQDGSGNDLPMQVSTAGVNFTGTVAGIDGLAPSGGTAGQVLTKDTATDYDYSWTTPAAGGGGTTNYIYQQNFGTGVSGYNSNSYFNVSIPLNGDIFFQNAIDLNPDATVFGPLNVYPGQTMNTVCIPVTACTTNSNITLRIWNSYTVGNDYGMPYQLQHSETIPVPANASEAFIVHNLATTWTPSNDTKYWFSLSSVDWTANFNIKNTMGRNGFNSNFITVFDTAGAPSSGLAVNTLYYTGVVPATLPIGQSYGHRDEGLFLLFK